MKLADVSRKAYRNKFLMEYCRKSSMHGVLYWSERQRPYFERFLWMILFLISLFISGKMIRNSWIKWSEHALAFTLESQPKHISMIPFPAFTICSMSRFQGVKLKYSQKAVEFESNVKNSFKLDTFDSLSQICKNGLSSEAFPAIKNSSNIYGTFRHYQQDPNEMFNECSFVRNQRRCKRFYQEVFTNHGRCYTFNGLNRRQMIRRRSLLASETNISVPLSNWTASRGFLSQKETYPHRVYQVMPDYGFTLRLKLNASDSDLLCYPMGVGILIQFHDPSEDPFMYERFHVLTLEQYGNIVISPEMTTTAQELHRYGPRERQCFFPHEKYLQHYIIYNERNCRIECLTNMTMVKCGCVFFDMPHNKSVKLCGKGSIPCYQRVRREMDQTVMKNAGVEDNNSCDCLPSCTSINYKTDILHHRMYLWEKNRSQIEEVLIKIYFLHTTFVPYQRSELYGLTEFMASCGGILGLFMGFSVLSLAELLYFFPIRYFRNKYKNHQLKKAEEIENIFIPTRGQLYKYVKPRF
ncbi:Epithelial sodium channel [Sergentomyia squamirostris]